MGLYRGHMGHTGYRVQGFESNVDFSYYWDIGWVFPLPSRVLEWSFLGGFYNSYYLFTVTVTVKRA